jgi:hypothetical protein
MQADGTELPTHFTHFVLITLKFSMAIYVKYNAEL